MVGAIEKCLGILLEPGHVYELRCPKAGKHKTISGYFDDFGTMARTAEALSGTVPAVYYTLNPVRPDLLARANNEHRYYAENTTGDSEVVRRLRLLVDTDPTRPAGISATDAEHEAAIERARAIRDFLTGRGFPAPMLADSGNGGHLVYAIDLPADDESRLLVEGFLISLAERFDDDKVKVDRTVFNAARISKVYGTMACKGESIPSRPHRLARLLESPDKLAPIPKDLLQAIGGERTAAKPGAVANQQPASRSSSRPESSAKPARPGNYTPEQVEEMMDESGYDYKPGKPYEGGTIWELVECPWADEHTTGRAGAAVFLRDGIIGFKCQHAHCAERDYKDLFGPVNGRAGSGLPQIIVNGRQQRDIADDALRALRQANNPPTYFIRGGLPTRLKKDPESGRPGFEVCTRPIMRNILSRVADWWKVGKDGGKTAAIVPEHVADDMLSLAEWPGFPPVRAVSESPIFVQGGKLVNTPGYDRASLLWLHLSEDWPGTPEKPTADEVQQAKDLLAELLVDFPFADEASRANAFALLLLPFVRPLIPGPTPLHLVNAPTAGTGKDLLAQLSPILATGRKCSTKSESHGEEEWRKNLTAWLTEGPQFVYLENVNYALSSATFAKCLTGTSHRDRLLGRNDVDREFPITCTWVATGNNVQMSEELARRVVEIRLDAEMERPWERNGFRHLLPDWAFENRKALVAACLTLIQAWVARGMPSIPPAYTIGSFERWSCVMNGILDTAGVAGFLDNRANVLDEVNSTAQEWRDFVAAWAGAYTTTTVTTAELTDLAREQDLLPSVFARKGDDPAQKMGLALAKHRGTVHGGYGIQKAGTNHAMKTCWRLVLVNGPKSAPEPPPAPLEPGREMGKASAPVPLTDDRKTARKVARNMRLEFPDGYFVEPDPSNLDSYRVGREVNGEQRWHDKNGPKDWALSEVKKQLAGHR